MSYFIYCYAEGHNAECHYAERRYAECRSASRIDLGGHFLVICQLTTFFTKGFEQKRCLSKV